MITAIIISISFFVIGLLEIIVAILWDWKDWIVKAGAITVIISIIVAASFSECYCDGIKKDSPKEYSASEYTFKIKVVEEQRDTILVVIPKEK